MKKTIAIFMAAFLLLLTACGGTTSNPSQQPTTPISTSAGDTQPTDELKPVTLKMGHLGSQQGAIQHASLYFKERVSELTDGKVTIEIYPGAQLGGERDMIESVANGTLSMVAPSIGPIGNFTPVLMGLTMPFLIKNEEVEYELYKSELITVDAFKELEKINLKGLGFVPTGFFQFGSNSKSIKNMEDMKGLTIRTQENPMMVDAFAAIGLNPTPMAFTEMYSALQTGVVDAAPSQTASWITEGFIEVIEHLSLVNSVPVAHALLINLEEFNSLPQEYQDALLQAGNETMDYMYEYSKQFNNEYLKQIKDMGKGVVEDFDRTGIDEAIQPVLEKYASQHPLVERTFELVQELNSKY